MSSPWNSLEIMKIVVSFLTPISVFFIGWFLNDRLKQQERTHAANQKILEGQLNKALWSDQKLTEKKLSLYDEWAPDLNKLYCFYRWRGYWKDVTPMDVVRTKRTLDKEVNIYRHIIGEAFYQRYQAFINLLFMPYTGLGHDAKIRALIQSGDGDRRAHRNYDWLKEYEALFAPPEEVADQTAIEASYGAMMLALTSSIGITDKVRNAE